MSGEIMNVGTDETQHPHDFEACNPKPVALSILKNNKTKNVSLKMPNKIEINIITTTLVMDRYIDSSPYFMRSNLS